MGILIFLNITLIVLLIILVLYIIKNSNFNIKGLLSKKDKINNIKNIKIEQSIENNLEFNKDERVFVGRFVSDEEYNQIVKNKKSNISILLEDVKREYEYLKKISNEG
jgi:hypothetical protein